VDVIVANPFLQNRAGFLSSHIGRRDVKIAVPKEYDVKETRVPLIPADAKILVEKGVEIAIESGMGAPMPDIMMQIMKRRELMLFPSARRFYPRLI